MANYMAVCRTNYFKVGRPKEFLAWVESISDLVWAPRDTGNPHDMVGMLYSNHPDGSGWPCWDDDGDEREDSFDACKG